MVSGQSSNLRCGSGSIAGAARRERRRWRTCGGSTGAGRSVRAAGSRRWRSGPGGLWGRCVITGLRGGALEVADGGGELVAAARVAEADDLAAVGGERIRPHRAAGPQAGVVDALADVQFGGRPIPVGIGESGCGGRRGRTRRRSSAGGARGSLGAGATLLGEGIAACGQSHPVRHGTRAGLGEGHERESAQTHVAATPVDGDALDPGLGAGLGDEQVQSVAVAVATRLGCREHGFGCESAVRNGGGIQIDVPSPTGGDGVGGLGDRLAAGGAEARGDGPSSPGQTPGCSSKEASADGGAQTPPHCSISTRRLSRRSLLAYARSTALPTVWARHNSMTACAVSVHSLAHVRNELRKPWTVALGPSPAVCSTFMSVMSLSVCLRLMGEGKTRALPPSACAWKGWLKLSSTY